MCDKECKKGTGCSNVGCYLKKFHTGADKAVLSRELEDMFLVSGRDLRRIISTLRMNGEPICSDFHRGYYYADSLDEVNDTVRTLNEHLAGVFSSVTALRNAQVRKPKVEGIKIYVMTEDGQMEEFSIGMA